MGHRLRLTARPAPATSRRWHRGTTGWLAISGLLAAVSGALWAAPTAVFDWQPARAFDEPWRLWTAAGVHWSVRHLAGNLAGLAVVAAFGVVAGVPGRLAWAWFAAWPLTHAALALQPGLLHYGGLSGVLHAGVAAVACWLVCAADSRGRRFGVMVLLGLVVKLLLESPWGPPLRTVPGWDIALAPLAHATGGVAGAVCGLAAVLWGRASDGRRDVDPACEH